MADEKRPRTGPSDDSEDSTATAPGTLRQPSVHFPPVGAIGTTNGHGIGHNGPLPLLPGANRTMGFNAPLTADGLSGLVELIAPTLSDGGGSGSSASGSGRDSAFCQVTPAHSAPHYAQRQDPLPGRGMSFLAGGTSPPHHGSGASAVASTAVAPTRLPSGIDQTNHPSPAGTATSAVQRQPSIRSACPLTPAHSAPSPGAALAPPHLPPRSKSSGSVPGAFEESAESCFEDDSPAGGMPVWMDDGTRPSAAARPRLAQRGPLPMDLESRPRAHLRTFMRSVGSVMLLAGTEALREAARVDVAEEDRQEDDAASVDDGGGGGGGAAARRGARRRGPLQSSGNHESYDPMEGADDEVSPRGSGLRRPEGGGGGRGSGSGDDEGDGLVDVLAEACRAEAWAAVAVGALFSGAGGEEGKEYVSRATRALSRCMDASLPEVGETVLC